LKRSTSLDLSNKGDQGDQRAKSARHKGKRAITPITLDHPFCLIEGVQVVIRLPLRTRSGNVGHGREHWAVRKRRVSAERLAVKVFWPWQLKGREWRFPLQVTLTRASPGVLDDDNLCAALKAVRDQVAAQLGVDDGDRARIRFAYEQTRNHSYSVTVDIRETRVTQCGGEIADT
jgi:hypothetical protein